MIVTRLCAARAGTDAELLLDLRPHRLRKKPAPALTCAITLALVAIAAAAGCGTAWPYVGGAVGATVLGGSAPTQELDQIYYVGMFDPMEQVPPSVYRITVRGQGSFISNVKFASGWVPAVLADSLGSSIGFNADGKLGITQPGADDMSKLKLGRRMVMFGPEGFMEAPADHRLCIVMGGDPSAFFNAISAGLGEVARVQREENTSAASLGIMQEYVRVQSEYDRLRDLRENLAAARGGGQ